MRLFTRCLFVVFTSLWAASAAAATGPAVADAFTTTDRPNDNYGNSDTLRVGPRNSSFALMQFDMSMFEGQEITAATLSVRVTRVQRTGYMRARPIMAAWSESKVTESNRPFIGSPILSSRTIQASDAGKSVTFNVLQLVRQWAQSPTTNFGVALLTGGESDADVYFSSREGVAAPVLTIRVKNAVYVSKSGGDYTDPVQAAADALRQDGWCQQPAWGDRCTIYIGPGAFVLRTTMQNRVAHFLVMGSGKHETWLVAGPGVTPAVKYGQISDLAIINRQRGGAIAAGVNTVELTRVLVHASGADHNVAFTGYGGSAIVDSELIAEGGRTTEAHSGFLSSSIYNSRLTAINGSELNVGVTGQTGAHVVNSHVTASGGRRAEGIKRLALDEGSSGTSIIDTTISVSGSESAVGFLMGEESESLGLAGLRIHAVAPDSTGVLIAGSSFYGAIDDVTIAGAVTGLDVVHTQLKMPVRRLFISATSTAFRYAARVQDELLFEDSVLQGPTAVQVASPGRVSFRRGVLNGARNSATPLRCTQVLGPTYAPLSSTCTGP